MILLVLIIGIGAVNAAEISGEQPADSDIVGISDDNEELNEDMQINEANSESKEDTELKCIESEEDMALKQSANTQDDELKAADSEKLSTEEEYVTDVESLDTYVESKILEGKNVKVNVCLRDKNNSQISENIAISVDDKDFKVYFVDGIRTINLGKLSAGKHKIIIYVDDYLIGTRTVTVQKKVTAKAKSIKAKKGEKKYFKITLKYKNKALKKFKFKIKVYTDGKYKTYTLKTDRKGIAKFNTKKLSFGTHKVVIYSSDVRYKISKTSKIKITQKGMHKITIKFKYDYELEQFLGYKKIGKGDILWVNYYPGYSPQDGMLDGFHVSGSGNYDLTCSYHKIKKVVVQFGNLYNGKVKIKNYKPNKWGEVSKTAPVDYIPIKAIIYYKSYNKRIA